MADWKEHVHPHGPIRQLADRMWQVTGSLPHMPLPRNMVVWRTDGGGLLLHSVVALDRSGMEELEALGDPEIMVVPNANHRADAAAYKERYPDLRVVCPEVTTRAVEKLVAVDETCEAALPRLGVTCHQPPGTRPMELAYDLPVDDTHRGLVFTDLIFNLRDHLPGLSGLLMRYVTQSTGFTGVTRLGRVLGISDRAALKLWLEEQALRDDLYVVAMGHGDPLVGREVPLLLGEAAGRL